MAIENIINNGALEAVLSVTAWPLFCVVLYIWFVILNKNK